MAWRGDDRHTCGPWHCLEATRLPFKLETRLVTVGMPLIIALQPPAVISLGRDLTGRARGNVCRASLRVKLRLERRHVSAVPFARRAERRIRRRFGLVSALLKRPPLGVPIRLRRVQLRLRCVQLIVCRGEDCLCCAGSGSKGSGVALSSGAEEQKASRMAVPQPSHATRP